VELAAATKPKLPAPLPIDLTIITGLLQKDAKKKDKRDRERTQ
jgi:hypothetical protein